MKGFQGNQATALTHLAKKYVPGQLTHAEFCTLILIAEDVNQEPDFAIQRYLNLRNQLRSTLYDTELQDGR